MFNYVRSYKGTHVVISLISDKIKVNLDLIDNLDLTNCGTIKISKNT